MNSGSRLHPFLIAAGLYAALVLPLAVLTRMTPVCLPGLIDFNADIEAILFGLVPAIAAGICLPPARYCDSRPPTTRPASPWRPQRAGGIA